MSIPKKKALQGFSFVIDPSEVLILNHNSDAISDISILFIIATQECKMNAWKVYTPSGVSRTWNSNPRVTGQRFWCFPHAECAVLDPGLKIPLGTGR